MHGHCKVKIGTRPDLSTYVYKLQLIKLYYKKRESTWDEKEVVDGQETHGRQIHQSLHFEAFHQSLEPVIINNQSWITFLLLKKHVT